jgi:argininosuccinate lyase
MFRDALRAVRLVGAAMASADFDVERLAARAGEGGTTLTELADHLVREHGIPFRTAHAIVARLLKAYREQPATPLGRVLADASADLLGAPLEYSDEAIARVLSPRHFVEVRKTHGGPAPSETARAIEASRRGLESDRAWLDRALQGTRAAASRLSERARAL